MTALNRAYRTHRINTEEEDALLAEWEVLMSAASSCAARMATESEAMRWLRDIASISAAVTLVASTAWYVSQPPLLIN